MEHLRGTRVTEERIELTTLPPAYTPPDHEDVYSLNNERGRQRISDQPAEPPEDAAYSVSAIPDGGYGWTIVACCSFLTFWNNGILNCWGVLQAALLDSTLSSTPPSTLSFVGSLGLAGSAALGLLVVRLIRMVGSRTTAILGVLFMGLSLIGSSFCTDNLGGLFGTAGVVAAVGICMVYTVANSLAVQYFSGHLGLANGLVKLGGGVGGCVMAIALEALNRRVGIAWTFRIQGLLTIGTGLPAAWLCIDRVPRKNNVSIVDLSMFKSIPFLAMFLAGAIGTFALFVPPYFLPLFARSIGLSSSTGAGLVAAFNACNAVGRFVGGPLCDKIGPINTFLGAMILNAVSMLAIWTVADTIGPLIIFAIINGVANGSFFTILPTVAAGMFGPGRASVAMSMTVTGFTGGYFMGAPIAGYLLQAAGGDQKDASKQGVAAYRPAIFYAGAISLVSSLFVIWGRTRLTSKFVKKV
ncbi:MFS general substrate transporter [Periconia macrospinosa]|uniref:MFS general substrate transporter n=1 Tax=Periconia macrospinosa TaxID=97972 RepID=A0A2V1D866_9PLEO|nr:MFS general substrate transporter [Periconia macrospinosa]